MIGVEEQFLWDLLQTDAPLKLYVCVDAGMHTHIHAHIEAWQPPAMQLQIRGVEIPEEASPWLVELKKMNTFSSWFLQEGFYTGWGIVLQSPKPLLKLAEQLQHGLVAWDPIEKYKLLLRFYDPKIIYGYLSVLTDEERDSFLHNVAAIWRPTGVKRGIEKLHMDNGKMLRTHYQHNDMLEALEEDEGMSGASV